MIRMYIDGNEIEIVKDSFILDFGDIDRDGCRSRVSFGRQVIKTQKKHEPIIRFKSCIIIVPMIKEYGLIVEVRGQAKSVNNCMIEFRQQSTPLTVCTEESKNKSLWDVVKGWFI